MTKTPLYYQKKPTPKVAIGGIVFLALILILIFKPGNNELKKPKLNQKYNYSTLDFKIKIPKHWHFINQIDQSIPNLHSLKKQDQIKTILDDSSQYIVFASSHDDASSISVLLRPSSQFNNVDSVTFLSILIPQIQSRFPDLVPVKPVQIMKKWNGHKNVAHLSFIPKNPSKTTDIQIKLWLVPGTKRYYLIQEKSNYLKKK